MSRHKRRVTPRALLVIIAAVASLLVTALSSSSPASADGMECHTAHRHIGISDGSIPIRIGWIEFNVDVCTDGHQMKTSWASTDHDTTGPGDAAGFHLDFYNPTRQVFTSGGDYTSAYQRWAASGRVRDCIPYTTLMCSLSENFTQKMSVRMRPKIDWYWNDGYHPLGGGCGHTRFALAHRVFNVYSWAYNTTSFGKVRFHC